MNLIDRAKNMIVSPKTEWEAVAAEEPDVAGIITGYVLPLAGIAAVAAFIGYGLVGMPVPFFGVVRGIGMGVTHAVQLLIVAVVSCLATAWVVDLLAPSFGSEKNFGRSVQLIAYMYTPSWIGGILMIYPPLGIIGSLFGLYGIYLMYLGLPVIMKTPSDKVVVYMIVVAVILILFYVILGAILGALFLAFGLSML
ncbi:MAG: YIP1 family protein [Ignavibacteria bacterium]|nr:YIP1 family protein [Ignavibacteria bacterium]